MTTSRVLADEYWAYHRHTSQFWNIDRGDVGQIERWEDLSAEGVATRIARLQDFGRRAGRTASAAGDLDASLDAAVAFSATATATALPWMRNRELVSGPFRFGTFLTILVPAYVLTTPEHGRGYIAKLAALPSFVDGWIDGLRDGVAAGQNSTARGLRDAIAEYDRVLSLPVSDDPLARQEPPTELSDVEAARWRGEVSTVIGRSVRPAVARLRDALAVELLPGGASDERPGLGHLPDGVDAYQGLLRAATSTDHDAATVHQIGLDQLARLDDEYRQLGPAVLGLADPAQMRERLRSDPSLQYGTVDEVLADARSMVERAGREAAGWFGRLPRATCAVTPVGTGVAYYTAPSPDGRRGGTFYINGDPRRWTRFSLAPTTFHETIPGHHLQLATAQELDLHPVLGELEVTAYNEGWGLYAERLADEMGLYTTPLERIGMLTLDSLRACRLVVDTGIHSKGWSRHEGIDFLNRHTALPMVAVEGEVDRYIAQPGQAASYMIGRLELDRLRARSADRLGPRFSVAAFHDAVLQGGMSPLDALARRIDLWVSGLSA